MVNTKALIFGDEDALKSVHIPPGLEEWLDILHGKSQTANALKSAWFAAVIDKRASGVTSIPRRMMSGETEIEEDDLPFVFDAGELLQRGSVALDIYGECYFAAVQNARRGLLEIRWLDPRTIKLRYDPVTGRFVAFDRYLNGRVVQSYIYDEKTKTAPGLVWAWTPGMNETGPGDTLARKCDLPARALYMGDEVMNSLFERGAIGVLAATTDQHISDTESERLGSLLMRIFERGRKGANRVAVVGSGVKLDKVNTPPSELELGPSADRWQRDICAAAGTPYELMNGDAANRATLDRSTQSWLSSTIYPHAMRMIRALNKHALNAAGYDLQLNMSAMDVDQEKEAAVAAAWEVYVRNGVNPETAAEMLGIDIPEGMPFVEGPSRAEMQAQAMAQAAMQNRPRPEDDEADEGQARKARELQQLHRFIKNKTYLAKPFQSDILTPAEIEAAITAEEWKDYP